MLLLLFLWSALVMTAAAAILAAQGNVDKRIMLAAWATSIAIIAAMFLGESVSTRA